MVVSSLPPFNPSSGNQGPRLKSLYLHVGTHKTGSTSIQSFMDDNRAELARRGLLYPRVGLENGAHHRLAWATGTGAHAADEALLEDAFASIEREAERANCGRILVSSEEFESTHDLHLLAPLRDRFDVRIVIYLRKQDHLLESTYNQHVRQYDKRFDGSIYQLALKYNFHNHFNYRRLVERWEAQFGRDNILVRPYGTAHVQRDVRQDVLSLIGIDGAGFRTEGRSSQRDNVSLATPAIPYMARINRLGLSYRQHQKALSELARQVPAIDGARLLSHWESSEFYKKFERGNRYIAERYLGLDEDPFAALVRSPPQETHVRPNAVDEETLQRVLSAVGLGGGPLQQGPPPGPRWRRLIPANRRR